MHALKPFSVRPLIVLSQFKWVRESGTSWPDLDETIMHTVCAVHAFKESTECSPTRMVRIPNFSAVEAIMVTKLMTPDICGLWLMSSR